MAGLLLSTDAVARPVSAELALAASSVLVLCAPGEDLAAVETAIASRDLVVVHPHAARDVDPSAPPALYALVELSLPGAKELLERWSGRDGVMAIAVLAEGEPDRAALAAGAIATLCRPLQVADVLAHLRRFRERRERAAIRKERIERDQANAGLHLLERALAGVASDLLPRLRTSCRLFEAAPPGSVADDAMRSLDQVSERISALAGLGAQAAPWVGRVPLQGVAHSAVDSTPNAGAAIHVDAGSEVWAWAHAPALERVLHDLLVHALRTVPRDSTAGVRVRVYSTLTEARISVRYEHPGIHASDCEALFVPFLPCRSGSDALALARARHAVAHMGGALTVSVEGPSWVVFRVRLRTGRALLSAGDADAPESAPPSRRPRPARRGFEVLVVDDDPDTLSAIAEALEADGYAVSRAQDGRDALAAIAEHRPAAVLVDLMMPVMDGWQLLSTLRRTPEYADIPVVVLSAMTERRPPKACFVPKPMRLEVLLDAVRAACDGPRAACDPS